MDNRWRLFCKRNNTLEKQQAKGNNNERVKETNSKMYQIDRSAQARAGAMAVDLAENEV